MPGKLYIKTFGCQMNEYDSTKMADVLRVSHGLELTDDPVQADVLLLNTCSVREKAQEKVFSQLGRWKKWKTDRPELVIGVGGCVASQEGVRLPIAHLTLILYSVLKPCIDFLLCWMKCGARGLR